MFESYLKPPISFLTLTGSIVTFNSQYAGLPLASCNIAVTAMQSGSGTPSPDNVRAISGRSECNVTRCGKNLCNFFNDGKVPSVINGALVNYNGCRTGYIKVHPLTMYTLSATSLPIPDCSIFYYDKDYNYLNYGYINVLPLTRTTPRDCCYIMLRSDGALTNIVNAQLELGTTATEYEAFNGGTDTISLGQTVYGGEYDARTGVLTVTHGYIASYNGEVINEPWISSMDKYVEGGTPTSGAQVVYPLSTPTTIQLPPCPIDTLEGVNNIWADTGDTTLQYAKFG